MNEKIRPKVGVAAIIYQNGKVLLGKRRNSHGAGTWAPPGGHLEYMEEIEECARREVLEETGLQIKNIKRLTFTNDFYKDQDKHYVTCFVRADYDSGDLTNLEPEKSEEWEWFMPNNLPTPLFLPIQNLLKVNNKL